MGVYRCPNHPQGPTIEGQDYADFGTDPQTGERVVFQYCPICRKYVRRTRV